MVSLNEEKKPMVYGSTTESIDQRTSRKGYYAPKSTAVADLMSSWPDAKEAPPPRRSVTSAPTGAGSTDGPQEDKSPAVCLQGTPADPKFKEMCDAIDGNAERDLRYELFRARMKGTAITEGM